MTLVDATATDSDVAHEVFTRWIESFGAALESQDASLAVVHWADDGYWRDILAFGWDFRTYGGRGDIEQALRERLPMAKPRCLRVAAGRMAPRKLRRSARNVVEGFFDFDTDLGRGSGFVRLVLNESDPFSSRIWTIVTTLQELTGFEETVGERRPTGVEFSVNFAGDNWLDKRRKATEFADRNPDVLIVGGGQGGLALAARCAQIGVDALVIEKHARIGDNWRTRYHSLTLHNEVWANSLPYMPFPDTWPTFIPKDKLAGWLEGYAEYMELNVWTSTEFLGGAFDEASSTWTVTVKRDDVEQHLRVPHVVLAAGAVSGKPKVPALPGLDRFGGEVMHSTDFRSGTRYRGKRAIVIGTGNSGHDVAQDLHSNGADVTIVQRSPTCVVSLVPSGTLVYALYTEGPSEDIDLITASIPYPVLAETYQWLTKKTSGLDRELLDKLDAVGFETDFGHDSTGFHMKYLRTGGGYYINVGCSDLIADKKIGLAHARDIRTFTTDGLTLSDGTVIPSDLVVLATGYETQQESVRAMFGDAVADRIGNVWGFDDDGFMANMWRESGQKHLWMMGGALMEARLWSRFLALQLKADLEGIRTTAD
jgi:cation diffusion facilitator CzcD-associated flavoprotein CzcO